MPAASDDERAIDCPHCDAQAGEPCTRPDGTPAPAPHARRVKAAERNAAEAAAAVEAARRKAEAEAPARIRTKRFQRVYLSGRLELEARAAWTATAREELESMALNMEWAATARAKLTPSTLVVKGSTGQAVPNPLIAVALKFDAQALITARTLKITPDTRGTSAPADDDADAAAADEDRPATELDELAVLDFAAAKAKKKAGQTGKR